jgi:major membrane immunogen (membrane-anchored lipoprotein)
MTYRNIALAISAAALLTACGGSSSSSSSSDNGGSSSACSTYTTPAETVLAGALTGCTQLTADKTWTLDGRVEVPEGSELKIDSGTTVVGLEKSWLLINRGTLIADGVTFRGEAGATSGEWGGLTVVGHDTNDQIAGGYEVDSNLVAGSSRASSGTLRNLTINNTGYAVAQDQEINGLSLFGVSSATVVEGITVNQSGDDGVEIWGGSVNLTNVVISGAEDDSFDTDDGWTGTVDTLTITGGKKAGMELSGTTKATYKNVTITTTNGQEKEGGIYFKTKKGNAAGGTFVNVTINHGGANGNGALHSKNGSDASKGEAPGAFDATSTFSGLIINGAPDVTGSYEAEIRAAAGL